MQIGYDVTGKVWLAGDAVPVEWNGMTLTVLALSNAQLTEYNALPQSRGGTIFDGAHFTALVAPIQTPLDISDIDNLDKTLKALALLTRQYANALKAGTYVAKTVADTRGDFMTLYRALP